MKLTDILVGQKTLSFRKENGKNEKIYDDWSWIKKVLEPSDSWGKFVDEYSGGDDHDAEWSRQIHIALQIMGPPILRGMVGNLPPGSRDYNNILQGKFAETMKRLLENEGLKESIRQRVEAVRRGEKPGEFWMVFRNPETGEDEEGVLDAFFGPGADSKVPDYYLKNK